MIQIGDTQAIGDFMVKNYYTKEFILDLIDRVANQGLTAYYLVVKNATHNTNVTITGLTSGESYTEKSDDDGTVADLFCFQLGEQITISDGIQTMSKTLTTRSATYYFS